MEQNHLRQQADRAERLARNGFDAVTSERLMLLSREYRERADLLASFAKVSSDATIAY